MPFLTDVDVKIVPGVFQDGLQVWVFDGELVYQDKTGRKHSVAAGVRTNFASVKRWPLIFWFAGDTYHGPSGLHDEFYRTGIIDRATADRIFFEAMEEWDALRADLNWLQKRLFSARRFLMYQAVNIGGASRYAGGKPTGENQSPSETLGG